MLQGYLDYINALPHVAPPGVFGLHENADITKDLQEAQQLLDGLLLSQSTSTTSTATSGSTAGHTNARASCKGSTDEGQEEGANPAGEDRDGAATKAAAGADDCAAEAEAAAHVAVQSREDVIAEIAADILAQLPPVFDLEAAGKAYPQDYFNSMNTVLVQVRTTSTCHRHLMWSAHVTSMISFVSVCCSILHKYLAKGAKQASANTQPRHNQACLTDLCMPLLSFLQELARFNALLSVMRSSLMSLGQACKGLALMSTQLDKLGRSLFDGKVGSDGPAVRPCCVHQLNMGASVC